MKFSKVLDTVSCFLAFYLALILKYDSLLPYFWQQESFYISAAAILVTQLVFIWLSGINKGIWRFVSVVDAVRIVRVASAAALSGFALSFFLTRLNYIHRSVLFIDWILLVSLLMLTRLVTRFWIEKKSRQISSQSARDRILIIGAGTSGHNLLRDIVRDPSLGLVVGFIDDDTKKLGRELLGVPVIGLVDNIPEVAQENEITKVFIAIPSAEGRFIERVVEKCSQCDVLVKILPKVSDVLENKSEFSQLRNVTPEDLLGRKEVDLDQSTLRDFFKDKVVLITGAGGSIGSEICRQVIKHMPKVLVLFEQSEYNMYQIELELKKNFPDQKLISLLGDVRERSFLLQIFERYRPDYVYHAAAYKHVPMVEKNPYEGIKTNILGTLNVADVSAIYSVSKFVLISTDKAVNPTNIMGATKRVAEIVVQQNAIKNLNTKYSIVRFGNVLGSSGSVIPLFKKQIEEGGPVTLTHESIERFFMSIPEATKLVIQASLIGKGGEIFVLDMGSPVKIIDLARKMIKLSGLKEGRDIKIEVVGLRPGEKLFEELLADKEKTVMTTIPEIKIAIARPVDIESYKLIKELLNMNHSDSVASFRKKLKEIVPEYSPVIVPENEQSAYISPLFKESTTCT